jgi:hypothetical protein
LNTTLTIAFAVLLYSCALNPIRQQLDEARDDSSKLKGYEDRKLQLLTQLSSNRRKTQRAGRYHRAGGGRVTSESVLEDIHRIAAQAGVVIHDFSERHREVHFTAQAAFPQIRDLVDLLHEHEGRFVISALVLDNTKWPDFDGQLQMRAQIMTTINDEASSHS